MFDIDGTLVDWVSSLGAALEATAARLSALVGTEIWPDQLQAERDVTAAEPQMLGRPLKETRQEALRRLLSRHGVDDPLVLSDVVELFFRIRDSSLQALPDAEHTVATLAMRGFKMIAASNGNSSFERLPIASHFAYVRFAEDIGASKPDPKFFRSILDLAGARPDLAVSVGDRLENDYLPARSIGMSSVLVDRAGVCSDPGVLRVESLRELPLLLEIA